MQERHPIDEQFRKALANAEAAPPPSVWAGIAAAQEDRRRAAGWRWYIMAGSVLVGGLAIGIASYLGSSDPEHHTLERPRSKVLPAASSERGAPLTTESTVTAASNGDQAIATTAIGVDQVLGSNTDGVANAFEHPTLETGTLLPSTSGSRTGVENSIAFTQHPAATVPVRASSPLRATSSPATQPPVPEGVVDITSAGTERSEPALMDRERLDLLNPVLNIGLSAAAPHGVTLPRYHVPHGEWWLGATVGTNQSRTSWQGTDEDLANALEQGEGSLGQFVWGLAAGRQWRSGFGISTGVMTDRMERPFRHVAVDRTTTVREENYYVTLNNEVFLSNVDTVVTTTTKETVTQGVDRRSTIRIPLMGHWRTEWRRWAFGARTGLALELTRTEAGPALTRIADGTVGAARLTRAQRAERYPATVLGVVGLDLAYRLHEHWSLEAGYVAMPGAMSLSDRGPVQALTTRHGAEFRLIIHLPTRP